MHLVTRFLSPLFVLCFVLNGRAQINICTAPMPGDTNCYQTSRPSNGNPLTNHVPLPHQDCCNAMGVFQSLVLIQNGVILPGGAPAGTLYPGCVKDELPADANTCFSNNEKATTWYKFQVKPRPGGGTNIGDSAGLLRFKIIPLDVLADPAYNPNVLDNGSVGYGNTDYDFLLFKISPMQYATGGSCTAIKSSPAYGVTNSVIASCNWTGTRGPTGLFEPGTGTSMAGSAGQRFNKPLPVFVGDIFYLAIDNFSVNQQGFYLDFRGITAPDTNTAVLFNPELLSGDVNRIEGKIFRNLNNNCTREPSENMISGQLVIAEPGPSYGITNSAGAYSINTLGGSFSVKQIFNPFTGSLISQYCPANNASQNANFGTAINDTASGLDFANNITECPYLTIGVAHNNFRRCTKIHINVTVMNLGSVASSTATAVGLKLPSYIRFISADYPHTFSAGDSTYYFAVGAIGPNQSRVIATLDSVACIPGIQNMQQCLKASVTPGNSCIPNNPQFDGVDLEVSGVCQSQVPAFTIRNKGVAMTMPRPYRVFVDSIYAYTENFQLGAGDSLVFQVTTAPLNSVIRVEIDQSPYHPSSTFAAAQISCLISSAASVFFNPPGESPIVDISCGVIRDSYDPNMKEVFPVGIGSLGRIQPGRPLEYTIHFQNTGNDVAYRIVIADTLDSDLDMATFQPLGSSHPYRLEVSGRGRPVLRFIFDNILLPDSGANQLESNGFVSFSITPSPIAVLGTQIHNTGHIYFDFNPAVVTNTTINTLYEPTITTGIIDSVVVLATRETEHEHLQELISIFPNPGTEKLSIRAAGGMPVQSIMIFDVQGKKLIEEIPANASTEHSISVSRLPKGLYFIEIGTRSGKAVKRWVKE